MRRKVTSRSQSWEVCIKIYAKSYKHTEMEYVIFLLSDYYVTYIVPGVLGWEMSIYCGKIRKNHEMLLDRYKIKTKYSYM